MSGGAIAFMAISWICVLTLCGWSFKTLLAGKKHFDPDGVGPLEPPEPPHAEKRKH